MYGNSYFGAVYYAPSYFGPVGDALVGGGAKSVRGKVGVSKKLSTEEIEGLEALGKAQTLEIIDKPSAESQEIEYILESPDSQVIPEKPLFLEIPEKLVEVDLQGMLETEQDIGLILAILEAHNN